jgi:DNA-binding XRE family transcriptional regulator
MAPAKPISRSHSQLGRRVDASRIEFGYSYADLAKRAGYSERTVRDFIKGKKTRVKTKIDICTAAKVDVERRSSKTRRRVSASDQVHGAYTFEQVQDYIGLFLAYRRSYDVRESLIRSLFEFTWSDDRNCLLFEQMQNYHSARLGRQMNHDQKGDVFISNSIGLVHLLTAQAGAIRLITLTKLHHDELTMSGVVLTQAERPGYFQPSVSAVHFRKVASNDKAGVIQKVGPIDATDEEFGPIDACLRRVESDVANFTNQLAPS